MIKARLSRKIVSAFGLLVFLIILSNGCREKQEEVSVSPNDNSLTLDDITKRVTPISKENNSRTAEQILSGMSLAYQNASSYSDRAKFVIEYETIEGNLESVQVPMMFAFERPSLVRMEVTNGLLVCNGANIYANAQSEAVFGQILEKLAPEGAISITDLYPDYILSQSMELPVSPEVITVPPQILLLLAEEPLKTLVPEEAEVKLLEPKSIGPMVCERVKIETSENSRVLWIERKSNILLRMEFSPEGLELAEGLKRVTSLNAEFFEAQLNPVIDRSQAFTMEEPEWARHVQNFVPPEVELLGKKPDFPEEGILTDPSGDVLTFQALRGKTNILLFWAVASEPCEGAVREFSRLVRDFSSDEQFAFFTVSTELSDVSSSEIAKTFEYWNIDLPIFRPFSDRTLEVLEIDAIPTLVILDENGVIQYYHRGTNSAATLSILLKKYRIGELPFEKVSGEFKRQQELYKKMILKQAADGIYSNTGSGESIQESQIADFRYPDSFELKELWSSKLLNAPGNVTVVPGKDGSPELLVAYERGKYALVNKNGEINKTFTPNRLGEESLLTYSRTITTQDGKGRFLLGSPFGKKIFLLDEEFKTILEYPERDSFEISDAQFVKLDEEGRIGIVLGLVRGENFGCVRLIDFEGKTIWDDETITSPDQLGVFETVGEASSILVTDIDDVKGSIHELGTDGTQIGKISSFDENVIARFSCVDADGDGKNEICAIIPNSNDEMLNVVEIERDGSHVWTHTIPFGSHKQPIERISSGYLFEKETKTWLVAGYDGTVYFFDSNGERKDFFSYGREISGFALLEWDGKTVLVLSSPESLTAWELVMK